MTSIHAAAFNIPGYEGTHRRLSSLSVSSQNWAGAQRATARSFHQPERIAVLGSMGSSGQFQPRSRHAARMQTALAALTDITDSLPLLRSSEQQEDLVGVYDEMLVDKTGRMAKVQLVVSYMMTVLHMPHRHHDHDTFAWSLTPSSTTLVSSSCCPSSKQFTSPRSAASLRCELS